MTAQRWYRATHLLLCAANLLVLISLVGGVEQVRQAVVAANANQRRSQMRSVPTGDAS